MTARNGITCVEWAGPFAVRFDSVQQKKASKPVVYRVDDHDGPVYIGCTRLPLPVRLYKHRYSGTEFGAFLAQVAEGGKQACVWTIDGGDYDLESRLIESAQPRLCRQLSAHEGDGIGRLKPEGRLAAMTLRESGETYQAIAYRFGVTKQAVHRMLERCGAVAERVDPWPDGNVRQLKAMWDSGLSARQIGAALGASDDAVASKARRLGLPRRPIKQDTALPDRMVA